MSLNSDFRKANLDFFERELWQPGIALDKWIDPGLLHPGFFSLLPNLYPLELTLWLREGTSLGFFDHQQARDFLLTLDKQLNKNRDIDTPSEIDANKIFGSPLDFLVFEGNSLTIDADIFLPPGTQYRSKDEPLHSMFRSHLLLTSELMGNPDAVTFLEAVNWAPDEVWERIVNSSQLWTGSFESVSRGFAMTLTYMECAVAVPSPENDPDIAGIILNSIIQSIQKFRLGMHDLDRAVPRYFQFAGSLLGHSVQMGPPSLDEPRAIFSALSALIKQWIEIGEPAIAEHENTWWNIYLPTLERASSHHQSIYPSYSVQNVPRTRSME
jgi:hypothetical protein